MKRAFLVLLILVLALALVLIIRTARLRPDARKMPAAAAATLDEAGAVRRFVGAIQIPTESLYGRPPDAVQIGKFTDYLQTSFPRVAAQLPREVLKDGAVIYTWKGRDQSASPVVLMGHMDVVPVPAEALPQWQHPPYSGDVADGYIWGRGTIDDKIHVLSCSKRRTLCWEAASSRRAPSCSASVTMRRTAAVTAPRRLWPT